MLATAAPVDYKVPPTPYTRTFLGDGTVLEIRHKDGFVRVCKAHEWFFKGNKNPGYSIRCGHWFDPRQHTTPMN